MTADILEFPAPVETWAVHDHPERPLDQHALICSCAVCRAAIAKRAHDDPRSVIALKTSCDRILVTTEYLVEARFVDESLTSLLYVADDYVRALFIPGDTILTSPQRWWSQACDEDDRAAGRKRRRYRVAHRQSRARSRSRTLAPPGRPSGVQLVSLHTAVREERAKHRPLIAAAAEWAVGIGRPLDRDVLALILAARSGHCGDDITVARWTRTGVNTFLSVEVCNWCSLNRTLIPDRVPETLWLYLEFLFAATRIDPESDPLPELRKPLRCYAGLDEHGRPHRGPSDGRISCECFVEYRQ